MVHGQHGIKHLTDKKKRNTHSNFDSAMYVVAILTPLTTIPQIWTIWVNGLSEGVSLITWSLLLLSAVLWFIYAVVHREKHMAIMYLLWIITQLLVVGGILIR